jgi:hypothetical protein
VSGCVARISSGLMRQYMPLRSTLGRVNTRRGGADRSGSESPRAISSDRYAARNLTHVDDVYTQLKIQIKRTGQIQQQVDLLIAASRDGKTSAREVIVTDRARGTSCERERRSVAVRLSLPTCHGQVRTTVP